MNTLVSRPAPPEVVIYYAHEDSPAVLREVARLRAQLKETSYDIVVAGFCRSADALAGVRRVKTCAYTASDLTSMPYRAKLRQFTGNDYMGYVDLVPMRFFQDWPDYDRYWIIEQDVRFGADWSNLFDDLGSSEADLLCTTVQAHGDNPAWAHWTTLSTGGVEIPLSRRLKGFIPFGRVSRRLFETCDACYREGWSGHSEVLWPTIAREAGLHVEDIGGDGPFTPPNRRGRYYYNTPHDWSMFPGTFVYRPVFADRDLSGRESRFPQWLWHPVKA